VNVALIDYGSGNLHSAAKAFERAAYEAGLGAAITVTADPQAVRRADRVVLPGVGAFADCRRGLDSVPGMVDALTEAVRSTEEGVQRFVEPASGTLRMALSPATSPHLRAAGLRQDQPASQGHSGAQPRPSAQRVRGLGTVQGPHVSGRADQCPD